jgi:hypothetical protein
MTRWLLHEYLDRYDPMGEPRSVGVYEDDEALCSIERHKPVLDAVAALKKRAPHCLPIVFEEGRKVEILHAVREKSQYDALFTSIELAHCWAEMQTYENYVARQRRLDEPERFFGVTSMLVDNFPDWVAGMAPKSVWEWLREPALYSFDDS